MSSNIVCQTPQIPVSSVVTKPLDVVNLQVPQMPQMGISAPSANMMTTVSCDNFQVFGYSIPKKYVYVVAIVLVLGAGYYYKTVVLKKLEKQKEKEKEEKQQHLQQLQQQLQLQQAQPQGLPQFNNNQQEYMFDIPDYPSKQQ